MGPRPAARIRGQDPISRTIGEEKNDRKQEKAEPESDGAAGKGLAEDSSTTFVVDFLNSSEGIQLNRAFARISEPKVRRKVIELVKALAQEGED